MLNERLNTKWNIWLTGTVPRSKNIENWDKSISRGFIKDKQAEIGGVKHQIHKTKAVERSWCKLQQCRISHENSKHQLITSEESMPSKCLKIADNIN